MSTQEQILDYVMNTPQNTNPAILGNMLDSYGGGGGSGGGVTAIVCELDRDLGTLTNADKLLEAFNDMSAHPENIFNYGMVLKHKWSGSYPLSLSISNKTRAYIIDGHDAFGFLEDTTNLIVPHATDVYWVYSGSWSFSSSDIDENGTAVMQYIDE